MKPITLIITIVTLGTLTQLKEVHKTYSVKRITSAINMTGKGDDPNWKTAPVLSDFHFPWENETPPPTNFKALHDEAWLYCLFDVTDPDVNIFQDKNHKSEVASSSRAEIFFRINDKLAPYYCLEIDPLGRVLDYEGTYHRNFNRQWSWPAGELVIKTHRHDDGYTIEFAISKSSLEKLGLLKNKILQAGLYRANCSPNGKDEPGFKWISWVKPDSKTPDFHIPSSFGILELKD